MKDFSSWAEFLAWKENEVVESHWHFVQPTGKICSVKGQMKAYSVICANAFNFSRKLPREKFCLAGMTAKEDLKTGVVRLFTLQLIQTIHWN